MVGLRDNAQRRAALLPNFKYCRKLPLCSIDISFNVFHSQPALLLSLLPHNASTVSGSRSHIKPLFIFSASLLQTFATSYSSTTHITHLLIVTMTCFSCRLGPRCLTRDLRELGFKKKLVRKFVECPDSVTHATALLKSYSPPSRKPRKGRYNDLCLRKGSRKQRKSTRARTIASRWY